MRAAENDLATQQARRPISLTAAETAWITTAGADVRAVFDAPTRIPGPTAGAGGAACVSLRRTAGDQQLRRVAGPDADRYRVREGW